ncbi:MAG: formyltransferase family protein [Ilumatobacteraceae bacterium]
MVNLHFSLLPRWRGAAPVERALLAGDAVTGVCLMRVDEGLDTGAVYDRVEVPIGPTTTADELPRRTRPARRRDAGRPPPRRTGGSR